MDTTDRMISLPEQHRLDHTDFSAPDTGYSDTIDLIHDISELESIVGHPGPRAVEKVHSKLHDIDRIWLSQSPLCFIATSDKYSNLDISPRGDPAGFIHVIDAHTIALPERPGNKRADSLHNIMENPHISLICIVPGRNDVLRINARAAIAKDASFFDSMIVKNHRPELAIMVYIEEIYYHCAKAFIRSDIWQKASDRTHQNSGTSSVPSAAQIAKAFTNSMTLDELEKHYSPANYARGLYQKL